MREIIFRGKRENNGKWVCGSLLVWSDGSTDICCTDPDDENELLKFAVYPETVGQFTGVTDDNGKKIFEDDIVLFNYIGRNRGVHGKALVCFNNGKFGVFWGWHKEFVPLDGFANTTLEVIGNMHNNPKLLEEGDS
jgi:hypothetical protein